MQGETKASCMSAMGFKTLCPMACSRSTIYGTSFADKDAAVTQMTSCLRRSLQCCSWR